MNAAGIRRNDFVSANRCVKEDRRGRVALRASTRAFVADAITPISAYHALAEPGRACLLESVEGTERISRYSFLGLDYLAAEAIDGADAASTIDRLRAVIRGFEVEGRQELPFAGGVVALCSYDLVRALEHVGEVLPADAPIPAIYAVVPGTWLVFDHFSHSLTLVGFSRDAAEQSVVEARLAEYERRLLWTRPSLPGPFAATKPERRSLSHETFLEGVAKAKRAIYEGDVYQLQLSVRFEAPVEGEPFDLYRRVRAKNPSPYMFFLDTPYGAVLGASPEFLVRLDGSTARLRPLAGTRPRHEDPLVEARVMRELLADQKERAEHVMLVDLARNDLGRVCRFGSVRVDELMTIEKYSHVMHIVSNVVGELREDCDAVDLFSAAYPAGTVTGTPKIRAMQIINTLEPLARGFYAGSVAHFDFDGDMDSCITLRSAHVRDGRVYFQAAAGIVADSDPEAEYAEVHHKTRIIAEALGLTPW
ncbi:MAG: anthranilate synthase component I family protein [bacterium]|nr:anthranilate synthase component I family protein [bacterium]